MMLLKLPRTESQEMLKQAHEFRSFVETWINQKHPPLANTLQSPNP
jgi:hypothetical protein